MDVYEWMRLPDSRRSAERARRQVRREGSAAVHADARIAQLEVSLERSMAMNLALWELVSEKLELSSEALEGKLSELELRTPPAEGERESQACACCGKANRGARVRCFFCDEFITAADGASALELSAGKDDEAE